MHKLRAGGIPDNPDLGIIVDIVGGIFDFDNILVLDEFSGVLVLDLVDGRPVDVVQKGGGGHGGKLMDAFSRNERNGQMGQFRFHVHKVVIGPLVISLPVLIVGQKAPWTLHAGIVDLKIPNSPLLIENKVEGLWQTGASHILVIPGLAWKIGVQPVEDADIPGFTENNVDFSPVCFPSRFSGRYESGVGMVEAFVMLFTEFVHIRALRGISLFPECFYKKIPLSVGLELEKDVPLDTGDEVDHLLFQPRTVILREVSGLEFFLRHGKQRGKAQHQT